MYPNISMFFAMIAQQGIETEIASECPGACKIRMNISLKSFFFQEKISAELAIST